MPKTAPSRWYALVATLSFAAIGLSGCSPQPAPPDDDRPLVLATFTVLADLTRVVAGDHVRVESITKPGAEIHGYEPTPSDLVRASGADLVIENGLGLEAWFEPFIEQVGAPSVTVSEGVAVLSIASDAAAGAPNPHAWMSPTEAERYIENIAAALSELVPERANDFAANAAAYRLELAALRDELVSVLDQLPPPQRALVTCEGAFSYLARDAGLTERYVWPVNAEQQATPQRLADTIEFVQANDVAAVFCESTVSDRPMQQVVEATGAAFGGTLYVDSLSEPDGPVPTYLELIRHNLRTITAALAADGGGS
jgi:manganese transport system substrate-binding protein